MLFFEAFVNMIPYCANNEARYGFDEIYRCGPGGFQTQQGSKPAAESPPLAV
jgi:hypothetical protein